jgi:hypothetical protein
MAALTGVPPFVEVGNALPASPLVPKSIAQVAGSLVNFTRGVSYRYPKKGMAARAELLSRSLSIQRDSI